MEKIPNLVARFSLIFWASVLPYITGAESALFHPETGLRIAHYRAPVPDPPPGIEAIGGDRVETLMQSNAVLVDVHPLRVFEIADDGTWIVPEPLQTLPGGVWLPVVGWGEIEDWAKDYLAESLKQIVDTDGPVIVYCRIDCWLSWNAAQRVAALGYETKWFPGGSDEWADFGGSLNPVLPWPVSK